MILTDAHCVPGKVCENFQFEVVFQSPLALDAQFGRLISELSELMRTHIFHLLQIKVRALKSSENKAFGIFQVCHPKLIAIVKLNLLVLLLVLLH